MANDLHSAPSDIDAGNLHDVAAAFAAIDEPGLGDPSPGSTQQRHPADDARNANGQFRQRSGPPPMAEVVDVRKADPHQIKHGEIEGDEKPNAEIDAAAADDVSEADDEWFEFEVERDGKPVKERLKAADVWQGYQERDQVRQEFEEYRKNSIPPEQWDHGVLQLQQDRAQLLRTLNVQRQMFQPARPNRELLNEESPRYNPALYGRQEAAYHAQIEHVQEIERAIQHHESIQQQQVAALVEAQKAREKSKMQQFWPEIADGKEAARVRDEAIKHWGKYGVSDDLINSVHNAAFYAILKDAIAFRRGQQAREAAVKVVRAKPKLVRAQARETTNPQHAHLNTAMQRLRTTNSVEDAAAAFASLG